MTFADEITIGPIEQRKLEQFRFKLTGRWSQRVVNERLRIFNDLMLRERTARSREAFGLPEGRARVSPDPEEA